MTVEPCDLGRRVWSAMSKISAWKVGVKSETTHHGRSTGTCKTNVRASTRSADVAGTPDVAHKAEHEGVICVEAIKGRHPHTRTSG